MFNKTKPCCKDTKIISFAQGFYLIYKGMPNLDETKKDVLDCLNFIINFTGDIPGASPIECGNYLDLNLDMAKYYAKRYKDILENN